MVHSRLFMVKPACSHLRVYFSGIWPQKMPWTIRPCASPSRCVNVASDTPLQTRRARPRRPSHACWGISAGGRVERVRVCALPSCRAALWSSRLCTRCRSLRIDDRSEHYHPSTLDANWHGHNTERRARTPQRQDCHHALAHSRPRVRFPNTPPIRRGRAGQAIPSRLLYSMSTSPRTRPRQHAAYVGDVSLTLARAYRRTNTVRQSFVRQLGIVVLEP
ncbi:hypothetical protein BDW22DRAFT_702319 [Trametopsis cervina]|nr:hypothetical protein BDW22DRAFT_702319 [Trametopsis cervina]